MAFEKISAADQTLYDSDEQKRIRELVQKKGKDGNYQVWRSTKDERASLRPEDQTGERPELRSWMEGDGVFGGFRHTNQDELDAFDKEGADIKAKQAAYDKASAGMKEEFAGGGQGLNRTFRYKGRSIQNNPIRVDTQNPNNPAGHAMIYTKEYDPATDAYNKTVRETRHRVSLSTRNAKAGIAGSGNVQAAARGGTGRNAVTKSAKNARAETQAQGASTFNVGSETKGRSLGPKTDPAKAASKRKLR